VDERELRRLKMSELIERSSLGTPEAKAYRALTPLWVRLLILAGYYRDVA
jgi:hypothetical protein